MLSADGIAPMSVAKSSARLGGDGEEMRQGGHRLDQHQEARVADLHAELPLALGHQLGQQPHVLGAHDLGQHQCRDARHHGRLDVGYRQFERPVDAHDHVGAVLRHPRHGGGDRGTRFGLLGRDDRILEIEDQSVGTAGMGLGDEAFGQYRHEHQRTPVGRGMTCHFMALRKNQRRPTGTTLIEFCGLPSITRSV